MDHFLEVSDELPLPLEQVFAFFSDAGNLQRLTPDSLGFEILTPRPLEMRVGALIDYRLHLFGVPLAWRSEITEWNPPNSFVDEARRSPYALWHHRHTFASSPTGGTILGDRVQYRLPLSSLGDLAHPLVRWQLNAIFAYRRRAVRQALL